MGWERFCLGFNQRSGHGIRPGKPRQGPVDNGARRTCLDIQESNNCCPIIARRDRADLETLSREEATAVVLRFVENTEVSRPLVKEENKDDYWDIDKLDQREEEEELMEGGGREQMVRRVRDAKPKSCGGLVESG